jgi:hypothetical protein
MAIRSRRSGVTLVGRYSAIAFYGCLIAAAPAHGEPSTTPPAPVARPSPMAAAATVQRRASATDIVVTGTIEKRKGAWKRAESDHLVIFSKSDDDDLRRITKNLERLHFLMSRLYRHGEKSDDTLNPQIILVDSESRFRAMKLSDARAQEGPFPATFASRLYYDPREDGEILAMARADQIIELNTARRFNLDCEDYLAGGGLELCGPNVPNHMPIVRSWETMLYSAFAQHFMATYVPAAYPRWYIDGIGALFSTIDVSRNGNVDYAVPPAGYREIFKSYGYPNVEEILTGRYLRTQQKDAGWSPYDAWLLAHYFLFSNLKPQRRAQFEHYMAAIRQGAPMTEAAAIFGDMRRLQREITSYAERDIAFAHADTPQGPDADPLITTLSPGASSSIEARIELGTHLATRSADAGSPDADWVAQLHTTMAQLPYDADALLLAAEAECRSGRHGECLALAERVLARSPDDVRALAWKGVALTDRAIAGPAAARTEMLGTARRTIERAMTLDGQAPLPSIAYFQSFAKAGERVPQQAMLAMTRVVRSVPAAPAPRLYLGQELVRQGETDLARRIPAGH